MAQAPSTQTSDICRPQDQLALRPNTPSTTSTGLPGSEVAKTKPSGAGNGGRCGVGYSAVERDHAHRRPGRYPRTDPVLAAVPPAARPSPRTVQSNTEAAEQLEDLLVRRGMPTAVDSIAREHVESFIEDLDTRFKPATVGVRFCSPQQLFKWLLEEARSPRTRWHGCAHPRSPKIRPRS